MRPRDLTKKNWNEYANCLELRSGLSFEIGWATGGIGLRMQCASGSTVVSIPRKIFDKMVDWYLATCDETFWRGSIDGVNECFGKRIHRRGAWERFKIREWQISASRICYVEGKKVGVCDTPRVDRCVSIHGEGLADQVAFIHIQHKDFERIVHWYNSDFKDERKAA